ncbi:DNA polymerase III subunit delta [Bacillus sp. 165]|uniref:DNA polymerase III subunit delta n=1 Tax=Bacillus sp. 165 TaxID=1529117 RepID=UPI001ADD5767|nr:DNA polymerase III subunit delta [Bacillus sp. 165]MBO9129579.1 DNA polymerase III subunit delta [Bacillus sp. 165]
MNAIHKKIKQKQFAPLYLVYGTESYFINETIELLIKHALEEENRDFNAVVYDLDEVYLEEVVEDARTLPFFGERKVILIKSPLFLTAQKEKMEQNVKVLEEYIKEPSPFTVLVLIAPFEKLDERKKITKLVKKSAEVVEANVLQTQDIEKWIQERVKEQGVQIEGKAISLLVELVGSNIMMLSQEMNKLFLYIDEERLITEETVSSIVPKSAEQNVFALTEKVVKRDIGGALKILYELLTKQEEPIKILALLVTQFRLLYQVKELQGRGYNQNQIASHLSVHPYRVKLAMNQTKLFLPEELKKILNLLAEADYEMKTGKMEKKLILEFFIMRLNHLKE